jgi:hypothetical protein
MGESEAHQHTAAARAASDGAGVDEREAESTARAQFLAVGPIPPVSEDGIPGPTASELAYDHDHDHDECNHEHELDELEGGDGSLIKDKSHRFDDDPALAEVGAGVRDLAIGDTGPAVKKLQEALKDLGFTLSVHGTFNTQTAQVVEQFQTQAKLPASGKLDRATLAQMNARFATRKPYVTAAKREAPGLRAPTGKEWAAAKPPTALMRHTRLLDPTSKAAALEALSPARPGPKQPFNPSIGGVTYRERLAAMLEPKILSQWERLAKGKTAQHKDKRNLHSLDTAEKVGEKSKDATDKVFGSYRVGQKLEAGTNLVDKFAKEDKAIAAMSGPEKLRTARWRVEKIVRTDAEVQALNLAHEVDRQRAAEKQIIHEVTTELARKHEDKLLEIQRAWPASADTTTKTVHLQLFKGPTADGNRKILWRMFNTLVHEYLHTLQHSQWGTWREALSKQDEAKGHTLREGVTELLTRIVLADVNTADPKLRAGVEGPYYDADEPAPDVIRSGYNAEAGRAEELVGITGIRNLYAAYFLGQTHLVGG